ncbi:MAG: S1C family serine protease [Clostridiales Family XIII bacterium]|jgi:S1-C subfamily serine protease|nr:S1C family serine protease [Clostridiales Family XIII bacterium]
MFNNWDEKQEGGFATPFEEKEAAAPPEPQVTPEPPGMQPSWAQPASPIPPAPPQAPQPEPQAQQPQPQPYSYVTAAAGPQPAAPQPQPQPFAQPQPAPRPQAYTYTPPRAADPDAPYTQPQQRYAFASANQAPAPAPKPKKERLAGKGLSVFVVIAVIACAASGVGGGLLGAHLAGGGAQGGTGAVSSGSEITISPASDITVTEAVAKKVLPSVVGITSSGTVVGEDFFFGQYEQQVEGVGTGMIIDKSGYILTNSHVVMDGSVDTIKVLLNTGEEEEGKVIWNDKSLDLAVVKIEADGLVPVEIGSSSDIQIGSYVAAIGNPLGLEFKSSITQGVVSGLDRTIEVADDTGMNVVSMEGLIQVDAAINSGNSGGPLLNSQGQVIGVNTAKASAEGMGFAIPIDTAAPIIEKVINEGSFERVYMGVSAVDVGYVKENYPNVELKVDQGACLTAVNEGSPAKNAGLKVTDVITAVDGQEIAGSAALVKALLGYSAGDVVTVTYNRDGETLETKVTLASQSELEKIEQETNPFQNAPQRGQGQQAPNGEGW